VEIPAYILCYFTFIKLGRQIPLLSVMIISGLSLLATGFIHHGKYIIDKGISHKAMAEMEMRV
jgi:hypothetical protein